MSKAGMHNYFGRSTGDAVVRELAMGRDLDLFLEDAGSKPITPQEAYELGLNGGSREWKRRRGQARVEWLLPPMSLDCLPEYKRGTDEGSNREEDWLSRRDFMDSCDDRWYGPKDSVFWAFHEAPDGHFKLPHLWPVKLSRAGRPNYESATTLRAMREAASLSL